MKHYRFEPVAGGVVAAIARPDGGGRGNAAIVELGGRTLVFDTGLTPQAGEELRRAAERHGPVAWVVNSHWHADHIRGNQSFVDIEIIATVRTRELVETRAAAQLTEHKQVDWDEALASAEHDRDPHDKSFDARRHSVRELASTIAAVELRPPTRTFDGRLEIGECQIVTLGGGHTESDAFLVLSDRRVAIVGDLLTVEMHPWIGHGDPERWIEILSALEQLHVDRLVPGHGRAATLDDVRDFRAHLTAFLVDPDGIEFLYPEWDFWGDTADARSSASERACRPRGQIDWTTTRRRPSS